MLVAQLASVNTLDGLLMDGTWNLETGILKAKCWMQMGGKMTG